MSTQNGCSPATFLIETESRNTSANSEQNMVVMASDGPSPHSPSLRLFFPAPQPSRRHHAQSLLGPSFHDPRTHHVLESHPERAAPLSRRDNERCHRLCVFLCVSVREGNFRDNGKQTKCTGESKSFADCLYWLLLLEKVV